MPSLEEMEAAGKLEPLPCADRAGPAAQRCSALAVRCGCECRQRPGALCQRLRRSPYLRTAALRANDLRVAVREGHHAITLETLEGTLGLRPQEIRRLQKMRQRRNLDLYKGEMPVSAVEREAAVSAARELLLQTDEYVRRLRAEYFSG